MKPRDTGALRTIAGTTIIVDFMSLIWKIGLEKYPKVRDVFDVTCNLDRIETISKFKLKKRLELEEQKRNPLKLST